MPDHTTSAMKNPLEKAELNYLLFIVRKDCAKREKKRDTLVPIGDQSVEHLAEVRNRIQRGIDDRNIVLDKLTAMWTDV